MRARLVHTHEYASRVYGDPSSADEDDDADAEGKPKKARRVKKGKKSKKSKGKSADSFGWIFDEGGGALGDLAALPTPGTCPAFDGALHDALRHDERGNEGGVPFRGAKYFRCVSYIIYVRAIRLTSCFVHSVARRFRGEQKRLEGGRERGGGPGRPPGVRRAHGSERGPRVRVPRVLQPVSTFLFPCGRFD